MNIPKKSTTPLISPYSKLGMKDLPFPSEPVVDPYSTDPRRNGAIYAVSPASAQIEKFERLLVRPDDFPNRARLAYLWSKGDQERGRGMGKTALLRYFQHRINVDWGGTEFSGNFSAAVVYVAFPSQVDRRYMEQLALSALVDICKSGVLTASRAALRFDKLTEEQIAAITRNPDGTDSIENILDSSILGANNISSTSLDEEVEKQLQESGIQPAVARALARGEFENYLRTFRKDGNLVPFYVPHDTKILEYSRTFLFNDLVLYFRAAGFAGAYLFIDDIENLVDQMTRKHRIEFAKEFGLCTIRPGYANTTHNFFSCVLTTHQQASVGLSQAWADAGLSAIARLDPTSPNSVELPLPSEDQAREIIVAHLDYYRVDTSENGTAKPFTEDGINTLLKNRQNPRVLLSNAATVLNYAVQEKVVAIDDDVVKAAMDTSALPTVPDFTDGIDSAL